MVTNKYDLKKVADKLKRKNHQIEEEARASPSKIKKEITFHEDDGSILWATPGSSDW